MDSLRWFNTYPNVEYMIVEDSGAESVYDQVTKQYGETCTVLCNRPKRGQIQSIDRAYSKVTSPYIFHCEDDWEFFRSGFIEDSMDILQADHSVLQVWLRNDLLYGNEFRYEEMIQRSPSGVGYRIVKNQRSEKHPNATPGFSFNPGLRRLSDYRRVGPFRKLGHETEIADAFGQLDYYAVALTHAATTHIGWGRTVPDTFSFTHDTKFKGFARYVVPPIVFDAYGWGRRVVGGCISTWSSTRTGHYDAERSND